jgi:hypothetical protein
MHTINRELSPRPYIRIFVGRFHIRVAAASAVCGPAIVGDKTCNNPIVGEDHTKQSNNDAVAAVLVFVPSPGRGHNLLLNNLEEQ